MLHFSQFLIEYAKGDGNPTAKKHPLKNHFRAISTGSFDNLSWNKDDVGRFSDSFESSHGFASVYLRFKGSKTARLIPEILFKKHFKSSDAKNADPSKWIESNKGGTKIVEKGRKHIRLDKNFLKKEIQKGSGTKK